MKILIVEDDPTSRTVLKSLLAPYGDHAMAEDGKRAMQMYQTAVREREPYDLICLDIMMPKMDGQAVLKEIRKLESERGLPLEDRVKVIMTTAMTDEDNVMEAVTGECDAYMAKPIDRVELLDKLRYLELLEDKESGA